MLFFSVLIINFYHQNAFINKIKIKDHDFINIYFKKLHSYERVPELQIIASVRINLLLTVTKVLNSIYERETMQQVTLVQDMPRIEIPMEYLSLKKREKKTELFNATDHFYNACLWKKEAKHHTPR